MTTSTVIMAICCQVLSALTLKVEENCCLVETHDSLLEILVGQNEVTGEGGWGDGVAQEVVDVVITTLLLEVVAVVRRQLKARNWERREGEREEEE